MEPEERELLHRLLKVTEENNHMLHRMHRSVVLARIARIVYLLFTIAVAVAIYYFIKPYLGNIQASLHTLNTFMPR